jgi:hypothetical protein
LTLTIPLQRSSLDLLGGGGITIAAHNSTRSLAFDYAMDDAWIEAGRSDIHVPTPSEPSGRDLAHALVAAGTTDRVFGMRHMLGILLTPKLRNDVVNDIKLKYGDVQKALFIKIGNQLFTTARNCSETSPPLYHRIIKLS